MRLTVFGATGGVGREIVGQALAAGHEVTAVVRDPTGCRTDWTGPHCTGPSPWTTRARSGRRWRGGTRCSRGWARGAGGRTGSRSG